MTGVNKIAVFLDNNINCPANTVSMNIIHVQNPPLILDI